MGDDAFSLQRAAEGDPVALALYGLRTELLFVEEYLGQFERLRMSDPEMAERMLTSLAMTADTAKGFFNALVDLLLAGRAGGGGGGKVEPALWRLKQRGQ